MTIAPATEQRYVVYRLIDPRDNSTRYVGLSSHIHQRYAQHILGIGTTRKKGTRRDWIASLKQQNLVPVLDIIEGGIEDRYQAEEREAYWIRFYRALGADLTNIVEPHPIHVPLPLARQHGARKSADGMAPTTQLRQVRESLGATQEAVARRTRSLGLRTYIRAESGNRVTYDTATQILEAINSLLTEAGKPTVALDDLGLTLY